MGHVFISYSRRDTEIVDRFVNGLMQAGLKVWIDREDIKVGNTWRVQIVEAVDTSDAFVLVLSRHSAASDNVRKEIDLAQDSGKKMFVLLLERVTIPSELRYQLAGLQFADVPEFGFEASTDGLIKALKEYLASTSPTTETAQREVELVIQGVNLASFSQAKQEELLDFISRLANTNRSQLQIVNMAAGSVHVFMDTPSPAAFTLKTMALNQDKRFRMKNISAVRLKGNRKFIQTSVGLLTLAGIATLLRGRWARIFFGSCSCLTCVAVVGVLAWQSTRLSGQPKPQVNVPRSSSVPPTPIPVSDTITPEVVVPITGPSVTASPSFCYINVLRTYSYKGPSRGYEITSDEQYEQGDHFVVLMSDRSGLWLFGILPDQSRGWLRIDWLAGKCISPPIPTASYIPPLPKIIITHRPPPKH